MEEQESAGAVSGDGEPQAAHSLRDVQQLQGAHRHEISAGAAEAAREPHPSDTIAHWPPLSELNTPFPGQDPSSLREG